jgi:hypothetical protein
LIPETVFAPQASDTAPAALHHQGSMLRPHPATERIEARVVEKQGPAVKLLPLHVHGVSHFDYVWVQRNHPNQLRLITQVLKQQAAKNCAHAEMQKLLR